MNAFIFLTIFKGYGAQLFVGSSKINIFVAKTPEHPNGVF